MKLDINKLLKNESKDASLYVLVTFITGLGSFLVVPLFWTRLTPSDYGIIAISEIVGGVIGSIAGLSLDQSQNRFYFEWNEDERKRITGTLWLFNWASILIISFFLSLIFYPFSSFFFSKIEFYPFVFYAILISVVSNFSTFPLATIRIMQLPKYYVSLRLIFFFISLGLQFFYIIILDKGINGYFYAGIISGLVMIVLYTIFMLRFTKICINIKDVYEPLKFSIPIIPSALLGSIIIQVDRLLLQNYVDLKTLGIYSVSSKFAGLVNQLHGALKLSYGPFTYKMLSDGLDSGKLLLSKITSLYIFPLFVLVFTISIFIDDFILFANEQAYNEINGVVPFLSYITLISCLYIYMSPGIVLSKKTKLLSIPVIIQLIVLVGLGLILLSDFGIFGLLITKLFSGLIFLIVSIVISNRVYDWKPQFGFIFRGFAFSIFLLVLRKYLFFDSVFQNLSIDVIFIFVFVIWGLVELKFNLKSLI